MRNTHSVRAGRLAKAAATAAAFAAVAVLPSGAAATTVSPAGHNFTLGMTTVKFNINNGPGEGRCTMNGGGGTIPAYPANSNNSGPVSVPLTTRPTFHTCGLYDGPEDPFPYPIIDVSTDGNWALEFQAGTPGVKFKIPVNGIRFWYPGCNQLNTAPQVINGTWQNGTTPPVQTKSVLTTALSPIPFGTSCGSWTFEAGASFQVTNHSNQYLPIVHYP